MDSVSTPFQNRWILVEFIYADVRPTPALSDKVVWGALKASVVANFGDWGWGAIGDRLAGMSNAIMGPFISA